MKKLSIVFYVLIFVLSLMIPPTFAAVEYGKDFEFSPASAPHSPKSFDENNPKNSTVPTTPAWVMSPGQTVKVDVYVRNVPQSLVGAGFWLAYDSGAISVTTVEIYDGGTGGDGYSSLASPYTPFWDPTMSSATQISANELMILVATTSQVAPDADGDLVMARLTLECIAGGNTNLTFRVIEGYSTIVGTNPPPLGTTYDSEIVNNIVTIKQEVECLADADCNDGLWCTMPRTCVDNACTPLVMQARCDDTDDCTKNVCTESNPGCGKKCSVSTSVSCMKDDDCPGGPTDTCTAGTDCEAVAGTCEYPCDLSKVTSSADPCCLNPPCADETVCQIVITDYYVNGTTGNNSTNDGLTPGTAWKTITHALSQVSGTYDNRALIHVAASTYNTTMGEGGSESFPLIMKDYVSLQGEAYNVTIIDADQTGSVIKAELIDNFTIDGFTITGGSAIYGGGINLRYSSPTIKNCSIKENTATDINGGGIYLKQSSPSIHNCFISGNSALKQNGGAICCGDHSSPSIINCTIVGNEADNGYLEGGGALYIGNLSAPTVTNCILWDNDPDEINVKDAPVPSVTYSCVEGGYTGTGNTALDPKFFGTTYHLTYISPCIDSATSSGAPNADINGNARFDPTAIPNTGAGDYRYYDMGAFEYTGDSDGDGILDDWDNSGVVGDTPCTGGATENCDDNCTFTPNTNQDDGGDGDGVGTVCDNCPIHPNGPYLGTCAKQLTASMILIKWTSCTSNINCGTGEFCMLTQVDSNENGIGDTCECESDFDCNQSVDGVDTNIYKADYGRNPYSPRPCTNFDHCVGDLDCSKSVDGIDTLKFKEDYGRNQYNNPCPACSEQPSCVYE